MQKNTRPSKKDEIIFVLPPSFANNSHYLPHQVQSYPVAITCETPSTPTNFNVKLKDVFIISFPRASHQPATFCLVLLITTSSYHSFWNIPIFSIKEILWFVNSITARIDYRILHVKYCNQFFPMIYCSCHR